MSKADPFGFDMSVSSAKKKNPRGKRGLTGGSETSTQVCQHEGCSEAGKFRAPKSPDVLDEFYWFCKEHVRGRVLYRTNKTHRVHLATLEHEICRPRYIPHVDRLGWRFQSPLLVRVFHGDFSSWQKIPTCQNRMGLLYSFYNLFDSRHV